MQMLLLLLLTLSPEHKQLLTMVKQGDMIAADELASGVCQLPEDARRKACQDVIDRLKSSSGPAPELAVQGVKACMPKAPVEPKPEKAPEPKPEPRAEKPPEPRPEPKAERVPEPRPDPATRAEPGRGEEPRRPVTSEPTPAVDDRRPVTAAEPAPSRARDAPSGRAGGAGSAALPDGDVDEAEPSPEVEVAMATPVDDEVLPELAPLPEPAAPAAGIAATDRGALREALTYYSIGGGLVAVGAVSALAAVGALANGALLVSQLAPLQQQNPQAYQSQSAALWTTWGLLGGAAAGMAALAAGGGVALMWLGGDRVEQL